MCKFENLEKAMDYCDATVDLKHVDYIICKIYDFSQDTDRVYYDKILEYFSLKHFEKYK